VAERIVRGVLVAGAAFFLVIGVWALADPTSFYTQVATFPPYNRHFLHDVGAFNLGLAAALALGLTRWPGRRVALWAAALAAVLHAGSHFADRHLGGHSSDPLALSLIAAALIGAAILATRGPEPAREVTQDATDSPAARLRRDRSARTTQPD
jgi:peptidoglycan/LPS O-acetylase OafA/YrhL